jgi:hypothetical protein
MRIAYQRALLGDKLTNKARGGFGLDSIDWTDEMRKQHSERAKIYTQKRWDLMTPEERAEHSAATSRGLKEWRESLTEEEIIFYSEISRKANERRSFEERSETTRAWQANKTPEERKATAQKGADSQTPEQHRNNALKAAASRTYEQRCESARKRVENTPPEKRSEAGKKAAQTRKAKREAAGITYVPNPECSKSLKKVWDAKTEEELKEFGARVSAGKQKVPKEQRTLSAKKAWETRRKRAQDKLVSE